MPSPEFHLSVHKAGWLLPHYISQTQGFYLISGVFLVCLQLKLIHYFPFFLYSFIYSFIIIFSHFYIDLLICLHIKNNKIKWRSIYFYRFSKWISMIYLLSNTDLSITQIHNWISNELTLNLLILLNFEIVSGNLGLEGEREVVSCGQKEIWLSNGELRGYK